MGYGGRSKGKAGAAKDMGVKAGGLAGKLRGGEVQKGHFDISEAGAFRVLLRCNASFDLAAVAGTPCIDGVASSTEVISSYVWDVTAPQSLPRIRIPGLPKSLCSPGAALHTKLTRDVQQFFVDENHFRLPQSPCAAMFQALRTMRPRCDLNSVDVMCESNSLRKLLGFLQGNCRATASLTTDGMRDNSFKLHVDAREQNRGILITRAELRDVIPASDYPSNTFAKAFEKNIVASLGHPDELYRRIIRFRLGGLMLLVCAEIDACEFRESKSSQYDEAAIWQTSQEFAAKFHCMEHGELITAEIGTAVEIKTKSIWSNDVDWDAYFLQLLFAGAGKLIIGFHERGYVREIQELTIAQVLRRANARNIEIQLLELESLLREMIDAAHCVDGGLDIFCGGRDMKPLIMKQRCIHSPSSC